jgi:hypothetical protein
MSRLGMLVVTGIALASSCAACAPGAAGPDGVVYADNATTLPVVVRIRSGVGDRSWLLRPSDTAVLLAGAQPVDGTIEVLDPETCSPVATMTSPPRGFGVDVSSDADSIIVVLMPPDNPSSSPRPPDFFGCP